MHAPIKANGVIDSLGKQSLDMNVDLVAWMSFLPFILLYFLATTLLATFSPLNISSRIICNLNCFDDSQKLYSFVNCPNHAFENCFNLYTDFLNMHIFKLCLSVMMCPEDPFSLF
jgi:hypothetical protein